MSEFALKTEIVGYLKNQFDFAHLDVDMGTIDAPRQHDLKDVNGAILVGSNGSVVTAQHRVPAENRAIKIEYMVDITFVVSVGYQTTKNNIEKLDHIADLVKNKLTNLLLSDSNRYPLQFRSKTPTISRKGALWTQLFFIKTYRFVQDIHSLN